MSRYRIRRIVFLAASGLLLLPFQNCTSQFRVRTESNNSQGNTGADGKVYLSYGTCANNQVGVVSGLLVAKDRASATMIRQNCQDLAQPQPIEINSVQFAPADLSVLTISGRVYDQQVSSGGQRVTLAYCTSTSPAVTSVVWGQVGSGSIINGSVALGNGNQTGTLNLQSPSAGSYVSVTGQSSQMQLSVTGQTGSLTYAIGGGSSQSVANMSCGSQSPAPTPSDGSINAPAGIPQSPTLLSSYTVRAPWKVAGVDYSVGYPSGQVLKNPVTDPVLAANPSVTIDTANHQITINGNNVVLDSYDFTLNGGLTVYVASGNNTTISNSNIDGVTTAPGTSGLIVTNCIMEGGQSALIEHQGAGALVVTYNWMKNISIHAVNLWNGGTLVYKYNLIENAGTANNGYNFLQFGGGTYPSVTIQFNTFYQTPQAAGGDEGLQLYAKNPPGSITAEVAYNSMMAVAPSGQRSMSFMMHIGGGTQFPTTVSATVHDNFMDATGAYGPFYAGVNNDGRASVGYSNNFDMTSGALFLTNP